MSNRLGNHIYGFDMYSAYDYGIKAAIAPEGYGDLTVILSNTQEFIDLE